MKGFLNYVPGNTVIHRLDPRTKILLALMICIAFFTCKNLFVLMGMLLFDIFIGFLGGIAKQTLHIFKSLLKFSIFLFVLQLLFIQSGNQLFPLVFGLRVTDYGLMVAVQVVLRLVGATLPLTIMISLTQLNDLSGVLVSKCHVPYKYAFAITSAFRFIPSFSNDISEIMEAQTARGVEFDTKNFFKKMKLVVPLCVPLLISSVGKIESAAIAAELRGFNLRTKDSGYKITRFGILDLWAFMVGLVLIAISIFFSLS